MAHRLISAANSAAKARNLAACTVRAYEVQKIGCPSRAPFGNEREYGTSALNTFQLNSLAKSPTSLFAFNSSGEYPDVPLKTIPVTSRSRSGFSRLKSPRDCRSNGKPMADRYSGFTGTSTWLQAR